MDYAHPAFDYIEANDCLEKSVGVKIVGPPKNLFASYEEKPDLRLTAAFRTDSDRLPVVVVKASRFSFLKDSVRIHRLVSEAAPELTPRVLCSCESEIGSILFLEHFMGDQVGNFGRDGLERVARSLAQIQSRVEFENLHAIGVSLTAPQDTEEAFAFCVDQILANFERVWEIDRDLELSTALHGSIDQVRPLLNAVKTMLPTMIGQVHGINLPLSIHHGDLHIGNAMIRPDGRALIFDWENGRGSHPFFSMEKLLTSAWALDVNAAAGPWGYVRSTPSQDIIRDVYLHEFGFEWPVIRNAFDAATCLGTILEMENEIVGLTLTRSGPLTF